MSRAFSGSDARCRMTRSPMLIALHAKFSGVERVDNDALVRWNSAFDRNARIVVKRWRVIHQEAIRQRAEARVDVIETLIRQTYGHELDVENIFESLRALRFRCEIHDLSTTQGPRRSSRQSPAPSKPIFSSSSNRSKPLSRNHCLNMGSSARLSIGMKWLAIALLP